ncbi:hypothetical protein V6N13_137181 [Hibiscus sabdariffa]
MDVGTGPVTVPSGFGDAVPLCVAPITTTWSPVHAAHLPGHAEAAPATTEEIATDAGINGADVAGLHGLSEVFAVDVSGHVHVSENALLGDEADDGESEVPGEEAPPIQLPAKRSSDGSDPSRVKRAKSVVSTLALKDTRNAKVWRLISDPDALLSRVLCARCFPSGDIFEASCPQRSSFSWKEIFKAFQKLKPGFLRRPGIGSRI